MTCASSYLGSGERETPMREGGTACGNCAIVVCLWEVDQNENRAMSAE